MNSAGRVRVRQDAADRAGDKKDVLRAIGAEPVVDRRLVAQLELVAGGGQDVGEALRFQAAENRRTDESGVAGDIDSRVSRDLYHARSLQERSGSVVACAPCSLTGVAPPSPRS